MPTSAILIAHGWDKEAYFIMLDTIVHILFLIMALDKDKCFIMGYKMLPAACDEAYILNGWFMFKFRKK